MTWAAAGKFAMVDKNGRHQCLGFLNMSRIFNARFRPSICYKRNRDTSKIQTSLTAATPHSKTSPQSTTFSSGYLRDAAAANRASRRRRILSSVKLLNDYKIAQKTLCKSAQKNKSFHYESYVWRNTVLRYVSRHFAINS
jgi:hypothetical protein